MSIRKFRGTFEDDQDDPKSRELTHSQDIVLCGRVTTIRKAGSKLLFLHITEHGGIGEFKVQVYIDLSKLKATDLSTEQDAVKKFGKLVEKGDTIAVIGQPFRTEAGELSLAAQKIPQLLAPCLHMTGDDISHNSDYAHDRHVHMRVNPSYIDVLRARSEMTVQMHHFFRMKGFVNVQTPVLAASAGGAAARPFVTTATEFPDRRLALRIAPELWLKKLIIGGLSQVYEIGPSFRNEGIDKTHNPEFTTCEFYAMHMNMDGLRIMTETLIQTLADKVGQTVNLDESFQRLILPTPKGSLKSWPGIDFIRALQESLECELPTLSDPGAREALLEIFHNKRIPMPSVPTLPRLLDKLCSIYIEPRCNKATWICSPPECLSPLARSMPHPEFPNQRIAVRAELFIKHKEVVNCYEEENSPFEQRRKFVDQQRLARIPGKDGKPEEEDDEAMQVDEDYIKALEWGMPPTGGWGCGLDRLLMLMLGKERIEDVLTFGNLRSVTWGAQKMQQYRDKAN